MRVAGRPGTYVLVMSCARHQLLPVGALGMLSVCPGYYLYAGSAFGPGGLAGRLRHHMVFAPRPHWHVDYLRAVTRLEQIWFSYDPIRREHQWASLLRDKSGSSIPLIGFGASDCLCESHLFGFRQPPSSIGFRRRVHRTLQGHEAIRTMRFPAR